jgi:hypothetical protein
MSSINTGISANLIDLLDIEQRLGRFKANAPRIVAGVMNEAGRRGRTRLLRGVRAELNLDAASINRRIRFVPASRNKPEARIVAAEKLPPLLTSFRGTRQLARDPKGTRRKGPVVAKPRKTGPREVHATAFIQTGRGGGKVPLRRRVENGRRVARYKTTAVYGPSPVGLLLGFPGLSDRISDDMLTYFASRIDGAIDGLLKRKAASANV